MTSLDKRLVILRNEQYQLDDDFVEVVKGKGGWRGGGDDVPE